MTTIEAGTFAEACFNQNSLHELNEAMAQEGADDTDCNTWGISPEEWRENIKAALSRTAEVALDAAIKHHESIAEGMPGSWSVETSDGSVMLVWSCDADDEAVSGMQSDEPFTAWGGDAIIADSGMRAFDTSGCDSYIDQYGDSIVSQWVEWRM